MDAVGFSDKMQIIRSDKKIQMQNSKEKETPMKKPKFGRILSLLLAGIMVFMMLPGMVTAAESDSAETVMESDVLPESEMGAEEDFAPSDEATEEAAAQPEETLGETVSEGAFRNIEADTEHGAAAANNGQFDKDRIAKIEIVQIKSDWWPNEYYRPVSGVKAMSLKLTDVFGNEKLITARDTVLEDGKNVPALKFYKIGFYIPENMKEHLRYEDFTVGGETERRIIFPSYEIDHLQIGIQWEVDPSVRVESDPNGNWFDQTGDKGFHVVPPPGTCRIKIYKSDDPQENDVTMINEDDRFNVVVTIDPQMSYISDRLFVEVPGIDGMVELKKTTIDRVPAYANVDDVGSLSFVPLSPSKTTMEDAKQRKSGVNYMVTAFNATHVLDVASYVVEGKDGIDKPQEYVTVTFASDADKMIELSLLDYLTYKTNCTYLSDLPHASWSKLLRVLERTPHQAFSAENWRECFANLIHTQLPDCVIDSHEVRYQLIHYLRYYHA